MFLDDLKLRSNLRPQAPSLTLATLINCITKPLMDLGITGFHDLTSANEKCIVSGKQLRTSKLEISKSTSWPLIGLLPLLTCLEHKS